MAKVKNKKNGNLADKVHNKRKAEAIKKKLNPFEVHINREKLKVLGKKSKHDRGLPGVSRAKAIQKRKETLGTEMKLINKTNTFIDRRVGEKGNLSAEDRMLARFASERAKHHNKKSIYNLADDEILTHKGQTLEQIEKFDDPRSSDDDDDDDEKKFSSLDNEFVGEGHFGGGFLSKSETKDGAKSHKDLIEQLIAESKKRKAEKQKEKEETLDLTEKLDSEWKDLQPVVFKRQKVEEESVIDKLLKKAEAQKGQDYDKMMRELKFEKRGTPSDGLKSQENIEAEEKKQREELEKQRQERMFSEEEMATPKILQTTIKHRSADDLDDDFELDDEKEFMLAYDKDGKPLVPEHILKDYSVPNSMKKFEDGVSDTSDEEGEDSDDGSESGNSSDIANSNEDSDTDSGDDNDDTNDGKNVQDIKDASNVNNCESNSNDEGIFNDDNNSVSLSEELKTPQHLLKEKEIVKRIDLKDQNGISQLENKNTGAIKNNTEKPTARLNDKESDTESEQGSDEETDDEPEELEISSLKNQNNNINSKDEGNESEGDSDLEKDIGSFYDFKSGSDFNLNELLKDKSPAQQSTAVAALIKKYDPSLAENNKEILSKIYAHLLQYINDLFTNLTDEGEIIKSFLIFNKIVPHVYNLAQTNKVSSKKFIVEVLKEKHDNYQKNQKKVPDLDTLIFFKLVSLLYPTSDFRHPVTTPSLIFMTEILRRSRFTDSYSLSRGIFIVALILEYTVLSKRYVPAALNFIRGILYLCANTSIVNPIQVIPPFRLHKDLKVLKLEQDCSKIKVELKMFAKDMLTEINDSFKMRCLATSVTMLREFFKNYNDMEPLEAIFEPHVQLMGRIDLELYPKNISELVNSVWEDIKKSFEVKTYTSMTREKIRPKALKLYDPEIQDVFTGKKHPKLSKQQAEKARLEVKYKKEMKGALREIRRDKSFIASVKIKQKIQSDNIRKEKVKQIYKDASIQQGELNKLKRMK